MSRFDDAIGIQKGASNALAITNVLLEAIKAARADGKTERDDVACRLIAHQLAFLFHTLAFDMRPEEYAQAIEACEKVAALEHAAKKAARDASRALTGNG